MRTASFIVVLVIGIAIGLTIGLLWPRQYASPLGVITQPVEPSPWANWQTSGDSVAVDPVSGWMRIQPDGINSDRAFIDLTASLPIVLEARARLVRGGRNYTLPWINIFCGTAEGGGGRIDYGSASQGLRTQWPIFVNKPDWPENLSSPRAAVPSRGENVWVTTRAVIETERGLFYAKYDEDMDFTLVSEERWAPVDSRVKRIAIEQPWDAQCDIEYLRVLKN